MRILLATIISVIASQQAIAGAYKCSNGDQTIYSDRPCPGGIEIRLDPAPPPPVRQPDRLRIIYQEHSPGYRYNRTQRNRLYASARKLEQRNRQLLLQLQQIDQRRERELHNAAIGNRQAMATINLYWQGKTDALQHEYQRNQRQIDRLRNLASERD